MKILALDLHAYGPFSGRYLDFIGKASPGQGLHCVYGANEAGKSSTLRALKAWLFGFPQRTGDDFVHSYAQLLVGGLLRLDDGQEIEFFRRKKRVADLVDRDGAPLDQDEVLPVVVSSLDQSLFETLYGIDHQDLVRGGEELLAGHGEVGEILFSAGSGMRSLHALLEELQQKADALYKPRGSKPDINASLQRHKILQKEIRGLTLSPERWLEQQKRVQDLERDLQKIEKQRRKKEGRKNLYLRLQHAVPLIARRTVLLQRLQELGDLPELSADFREQRVKVTVRIQEQRLELQKREERIKKLRAKIHDLPLSGHELIEHTSQIETLYRGLGGYTKAMQDRPNLVMLRKSEEKEARKLLALVNPQFELSEADGFDVFVSRARKIQQKVGQYDLLVSSQREVDDSLTSLRVHTEQVKAELQTLQAPIDDTSLPEALRSARAGFEIDDMISVQQIELQGATRQWENRLQRLGYWSGSMEEIATVRMVSVAAVNRFIELFRKLEHEKIQLGEKSLAVEEEGSRCREALDTLLHSGDVVHGEDLAAVRGERDRHWEWIRGKWLDQADASAFPYESDEELADGFAKLQAKGDMLADRLRREADRVQQHGALQAQLERIDREREVLDRGKKGHAATFEQTLTQWITLWKPLGITPGTPLEMLEWLDDWRDLCAAAENVTELRSRVNTLKKRRAELWHCLAAALPAAVLEREEESEKKLQPLLAIAETLLEKQREQQSRWHSLQKELVAVQEKERLKKEKQQVVKRELQEWRNEWQRLCHLPGHKEPLAPQDALDVLDILQKLQARLTEIRNFSKRIDGIDRDARAYEKQVVSILQRTKNLETTKSVPSQENLEETVAMLHGRLGKAVRDAALLQEYSGELDELEKVSDEQRLELDELEKLEQNFLQTAGCDTISALEKVEEKVSQQKDLTAKLTELEEDLVRLSGNAELTALEEKVAAIDPDQLPALIGETERCIEEELDPQIRRLSEQLGKERKTLEEMDGSDDAAQIAEEQQRNLAFLERRVQQYLELRLAMALLQNHIEEYRRKHQGPLLTLTAQLFTRITGGSFATVSADFDDRGNPVLVAVRPDGIRLNVEALSTGTRDQLYLALRLATLVHRKDKGESMPFIVDDVLINFDEERARATLEVLAEIGAYNQIILFTHSNQIAAMTKDLGPKAMLHAI